MLDKPSAGKMVKTESDARASTRSRQLTAPQQVARELVTQRLASLNLPATEEDLTKIVTEKKVKSRRKSAWEEETSESSSGEVGDQPGRQRTRVLKPSVKRKLSKYLDYMMEQSTTGLTVLERVAVSKAMDKNYLKLVEKLEKHLESVGVKIEEEEDIKVDKEVVEYMNRLWLKGVKAHTGNHLLAGILH